MTHPSVCWMMTTPKPAANRRPARKIFTREVIYGGSSIAALVLMTVAMQLEGIVV